MGDRQTVAAMMAQPDWIQAALDRKMAQEPGASFCYDSPGMHLLSAILQEATGMTALEFAQQYLFAPLGIQEVIWDADPQGYTRGWGDLHLKPPDMAKIGYLFLHGGVWHGKQIVPRGWVEEAPNHKPPLKSMMTMNWWYGPYFDFPPGYVIVTLYADGSSESEFVTY